MKRVSAHIFKKSNSPFHQLRYRLPDDLKWSVKSLRVRDKQTAEKLKTEFIIKHERQANGLTPSDEEVNQAREPLDTLIEEYRANLYAMNRSEDYVKTNCQQISTPIKECGWGIISDIRADDFIRWRSQDGKRGSRTLNHYLCSLKGFLNWLMRMERLQRNPLDVVQKVDESDDVRRKRRAYTIDEITDLHRVAPPERWIVYLTAIHTGIRRDEIFSMEWRDVHLECETAFVVLRAETTKNKKRESVCLHPEVADALRAYQSDDVKPGQKVFVFMSRMAKMRQDLQAAGIVYKNEFDEYADFHALRKTCNTRMAAHGVPSTIAKQQMRHSDIKLTMGPYLDTALLPVAGYIEAMPALISPNEDLVSHIVSHPVVHESQELSMSDTETKQGDTKKPFINKGFSRGLSSSDTVCQDGMNGSCAWDRTKDLVINSHPLYR